MTALETDMQIICTCHEEILSPQPRDMLGLGPCKQGEADSRIMLHLYLLSWKEIPICQFRTVDTDVVVLTTKAVESIGITELLAGFGVCYRFCLIATHEIADALSPQQSMAFLICSLPSLGVMVYIILVGRGGGGGEGGGRERRRETAWKEWMASNDVTKASCDLADKPSVINELINILERFIELLCDQTSNEHSVNKGR